MEGQLKNSNRQPLFSRDIHEKIAKGIMIAIGLMIAYGMIGLLFREPLKGIILIAVSYAVWVLNTRYPRINYRKRRLPKQK